SGHWPAVAKCPLLTQSGHRASIRRNGSSSARYFIIIIVVIRHETTAAASRALLLLVRTLFDDAIPLAVSTSFQVCLPDSIVTHNAPGTRFDAVQITDFPKQKRVKPVMLFTSIAQRVRYQG